MAMHTISGSCAQCNKDVKPDDFNQKTYLCKYDHSFPICGVVCERAFEKRCLKHHDSLRKMQHRLQNSSAASAMRQVPRAERDKLMALREAEITGSLLCPCATKALSVQHQYCSALLQVIEKSKNSDPEQMSTSASDSNHDDDGLLAGSDPDSSNDGQTKGPAPEVETPVLADDEMLVEIDRKDEWIAEADLFPAKKNKAQKKKSGKTPPQIFKLSSEKTSDEGGEEAELAAEESKQCDPDEQFSSTPMAEDNSCSDGPDTCPPPAPGTFYTAESKSAGLPPAPGTFYTGESKSGYPAPAPAIFYTAESKSACLPPAPGMFYTAESKSCATSPEAVLPPTDDISDSEAVSCPAAESASFDDSSAVVPPPGLEEALPMPPMPVVPGLIQMPPTHMQSTKSNSDKAMRKKEAKARKKAEKLQYQKSKYSELDRSLRAALSHHRASQPEARAAAQLEAPVVVPARRTPLAALSGRARTFEPMPANMANVRADHFRQSMPANMVMLPFEHVMLPNPPPPPPPLPESFFGSAISHEDTQQEMRPASFETAEQQIPAPALDHDDDSEMENQPEEMEQTLRGTAEQLVPAPRAENTDGAEESKQSVQAKPTAEVPCAQAQPASPTQDEKDLQSPRMGAGRRPRWAPVTHEDQDDEEELDIQDGEIPPLVPCSAPVQSPVTDRKFDPSDEKVQSPGLPRKFRPTAPVFVPRKVCGSALRDSDDDEEDKEESTRPSSPASEEIETAKSEESEPPSVTEDAHASEVPEACVASDSTEAAAEALQPSAKVTVCLDTKWCPMWSDTHQKYYYWDATTGETTWQKPVEDSDQFLCVEHWQPRADVSGAIALLHGDRLRVTWKESCEDRSGWAYGTVLGDCDKAGYFPQNHLAVPARSVCNFVVGQAYAVSERFDSPIGQGGYLSVIPGDVIIVLHQDPASNLWIFAKRGGSFSESGWLPEAVIKV
jgi:hypothetical protein